MLTPRVHELGLNERMLAHDRTKQRVEQSLLRRDERPPKRPREVRTVMGRWVNDA